MVFEALAAVVSQDPVVEPDPDIVTPGLLGLIMVLLLGIAIYLLFRSMNRHLRKVDFPEPEEADGSGDERSAAQ